MFYIFIYLINDVPSNLLIEPRPLYTQKHGIVSWGVTADNKAILSINVRNIKIIRAKNEVSFPYDIINIT